MRFFGLQDKPISVDQITSWLQTALIDGVIDSEIEDFPGDWTTITLSLDSGEAVVEIEKYSQADDSLAAALQDTVRMLLDDKHPVIPTSAVKWLCQFMGRVKVLYEFRPMQAVNTEAGWEIFNAVWTQLRESLQGIVYLEHEGFTNENGAQITWEYDKEEHGDLKVATLNKAGDQWVEYTIDLANQKQCERFKAGELPENSQ